MTFSLVSVMTVVPKSANQFFILVHFTTNTSGTGMADFF